MCAFGSQLCLRTPSRYLSAALSAMVLGAKIIGRAPKVRSASNTIMDVIRMRKHFQNSVCLFHPSAIFFVQIDIQLDEISSSHQMRSEGNVLASGTAFCQKFTCCKCACVVTKIARASYPDALAPDNSLNAKIFFFPGIEKIECPAFFPVPCKKENIVCIQIGFPVVRNFFARMNERPS